MIHIPLPTWLLALTTAVFIACIYAHGADNNLVSLIMSSIGFALCIPEVAYRVIKLCKSRRGKKL